MNAADFEVLTFADLRFSGGTSRAVLAEIAAAGQAGVVTGLCPVLSGAFSGPRGDHPGFAEAVAAGHAVLCDASEAVRAKIVLIHHPMLFQHLPTVPLRVEAGVVVLVLHHPPYDGFGQAAYDLSRIVRNIAEVFGAEVLLAPVSGTVREQLLRVAVPLGARILPFDWDNLIDLSAWPWRGDARPAGDGALVIGRHSRPDPLKFPDTRAEAVQWYPDRADMRVRMLGADGRVAQAYAPLPVNWELLAFGAGGVQAFLRGLDVYVYAHGRAWVEAFGYAVLEAMTIGVPAILPPSFAAVFGDAAIYAQPEGVAQAVEQLCGDAAGYAARSRKGRALAEGRHGLDQFLPRLRRLVDVAAPAVRRGEAARSRRVLFMTSNGVGLGHLTRAMAVAQAMPEGTMSSILTMSQGFRLAVEAGYLTQFVPHYRLTGADEVAWNAALAIEVADFLALTRPDVAVFDGNVPYAGVLAGLDTYPGVRRVWMRRGLWRAEIELPENSKEFDLVIAPGELSDRFDQGPTSGAGDAVGVAPVLGLRPEARLTRDAARAALEVSGDKVVVALMLGAGTNYDLRGIRGELLRCLSARADVQVIEIAAPLGAGGPDGSPGLRRMELYPAYRYTRGFDAMITGAGYNSFHENMLGGVPTLFVPNEADEMDMQVLRARHATRTGAGLMLRAWEKQAVQRVVEQLLDAGQRDRMRDRMALMATGVGDGAAEAARLILDLSYAVRASVGPHEG